MHGAGDGVITFGEFKDFVEDNEFGIHGESLHSWCMETFMAADAGFVNMELGMDEFKHLLLNTGIVMPSGGAPSTRVTRLLLEDVTCFLVVVQVTSKKRPRPTGGQPSQLAPRRPRRGSLRPRRGSLRQQRVAKRVTS